MSFQAVPNLQTVIVANKTDRDPGLREVTREEGHVFAIENGSRYYETSAKDPEMAKDVGEVFQVRCMYKSEICPSM